MKKTQWLNVVVGGLLILLLALVAGCGGGEPAESQAGPAPDFSTDSPYVSIEDFKREYDRGASMIILDARPKQDYDMDHIEGAISMPFFEVEERYEELPKDTWIVTYCACPRAEAEEAARILQENGYTKLKVLYDGYFEWLARDYPVASSTS